jgi:hypothetical protein
MNAIEFSSRMIDILSPLQNFDGTDHPRRLIRIQYDAKVQALFYQHPLGKSVEEFDEVGQLDRKH